MSGDDVSLQPAEIVEIQSVLAELETALTQVNTAFIQVGLASLGPTTAGIRANYHREGACESEASLLADIATQNTTVTDGFTAAIEEFGVADEVVQYQLAKALAQLTGMLSPFGAANGVTNGVSGVTAV